MEKKQDQPSGHSIECDCETCASNNQGVFQQRREYEDVILRDLRSIEVLGEIRLYDSLGHFTSRERKMTIDW